MLRVSGDELILTEHLLDFFESGGHLFFGVCGHEREADECVLGCDCGRNHRVDEDAFVE